MKPFITIVYGAASHAIFLASLVCTVAFFANVPLIATIDAVPRTAPAEALLINLCLLLLFSSQHCLMVKPGKQHWWTRQLSTSTARHSCLLVSGMCLAALLYWWQPIGRLVWQIDHPLARVLLHTGFGAGWLLVLFNALLLGRHDRTDLAGSWVRIRRRLFRTPESKSATRLRFRNPELYAGWLLAFWCTPVMTSAHLLFAVTCSGFVVSAALHEQKSRPVEIRSGHFSTIPDDIQ